MSECYINYQGTFGLKKTLRGLLMNYVKPEAGVKPKSLVEIFSTYVHNFEFNAKTRFNFNSMDPSDIVAKSMKKLYDDAKDILIEFSKNENYSDIVTDAFVEKTLEDFQNTLCVSLDLSLSESDITEPNEPIEGTTAKSVLDENTTNLNNHLKEIYGVGAYGIIKNMTIQFQNYMFSVAYQDSKTGELVPRVNSVLNRKINTLKELLYLDVLRYLQERYPDNPYILNFSTKRVLDEGGYVKTIKNDNDEMVVDETKQLVRDNYHVVMNLMYNVIKETPDFNNKLDSDYRNLADGSAQKNREKRYEGLIAFLDKTFPEFKEEVVKRLKSQDKAKQLYKFGELSENFNVVKSIIKDIIPSEKLKELKYEEGEGDLKVQRGVLETLDYIESRDNTLLNAVNAYTMLTHFDELMSDALHGDISIAKGEKGIETNNANKYQYSLDTSHQRKSWQTSEDIGSEQHTAELTKLVLSQIKVIDYATGRYKNKSCDMTSVIFAFRHLLSDAQYRDLKFSTEAQYINDFFKHCDSFHGSPEEKIRLILEALFKRVDGGVNQIRSKKLLTNGDIDILYSIYEKVFNLDNPTSLASLEMENTRQSKGAVQRLCQEISGLADRNVTLDYLETGVDYETGSTTIKIKRKYFNNRRLYKLQERINVYANNDTEEKTTKLVDKYGYEKHETNTGNTYSARIGGEDFVLITPQTASILVNSEHVKWQNSELFKRLNNVNITTLVDHLKSGTALTEDEKLFDSVMLFLEDSLGFAYSLDRDRILYTMQIYKEGYTADSHYVVGNTFLEPLVQLGFRVMYAKKAYSEANQKGETLDKYLDGNTNYENFKAGNNKLFTKYYNTVKFNVIGYSDLVLEQIANAQSVFSGESARSTTKDYAGNNIPNNGINKLGTNLKYYLGKLREGKNSSNLLFVLKLSLIKGIVHDLEVTTKNNDKKAVKDFSNGELFFHSIFNKFWGNYITDGTVIILPTVYSDKTTFINIQVDPKILDGNTVESQDILKSNSYQEEVIDAYIKTIGSVYSGAFADTKAKLQKAANHYYGNNDPKNQVTYTLTELKAFLASVTEPELIKIGKEIGEDFALDLDYRKLSDGHLGINELVQYNAKLYNDKTLLGNILELQKIIFVKQLISSNSRFLMIPYGAKYDDYATYDKKNSDAENTSVKYNTQLLNIVKKLYKPKERAEFFQNWVDKRTGQLILAKLNDLNILRKLPNETDNVILNPLLDKFFYVEQLLSNNLRFNYTGSETNHPNKAYNTVYDSVLKSESMKDCQVSFDSEDLYKAVKEYLLNTRSVSDILDNLDSNPLIKDKLLEIYDKTLQKISNVAQGTQFKRNVIIPATLQYVQSDSFEGVPAKIKCAVIRDLKAPVYNYRGDHEKDIDATDGVAKINPFQSILENKALGSQAVGFTKKPIWHSYDSSSCTVFLAKFATNTITNELMRMSMLSDESDYKLFKKMTNLQWEIDPETGKKDVDLTTSVFIGNIYSGVSSSSGANKLKALSDAEGRRKKWWQREILGNTSVNSYGLNTTEKRLFYKNKYGDKVEICGFGKDLDTNQYFTEEKNTTDTSDTAVVTRVYHLYDENGNYVRVAINKNDKLPKEFKKYRTINSLFELHNALGGINCCDSEGKYSEFNNEVVVNFMNYTGYPVKGLDKDNATINLRNYVQPLKKYMIGYALNNTAVKNGAKNINLASAWTDDSELTYFDVDADGLGIQMNADHDIINSELTEFSQVITATSAYAFTQENTREIFRGLALAALSSQRLLLSATDKFIEAHFEPEKRAKAQSNLYDSIGRIIFAKEQIKDKENLLKIIMESVTDVFSKNRNHGDDDVKIPYSDPNIFTDFIANLASGINSTAIKRKHTGTGAVLVAAYNTAMYFEFDGKKVTTFDLLPAAMEDYKQEIIQSIMTHESYKDGKVTVNDKLVSFGSTNTLRQLLQLQADLGIQLETGYNLDDQAQMMNNYLEKRLKDAAIYEDRNFFMPSDVVNIINDEGTNLKTVRLDSMDDYYKFSDGLFDSEIRNDVSIKVDYKKGKYTVSLNEAPNQQFVIEKEWKDGVATGKYNIHFKTGGPATAESNFRRTVEGKPNEEQVERLLRAAMDCVPVGGIIRLSPSTAEQIRSKLGGLTAGSIHGYNRIDNTERYSDFEKLGAYDVTYTDKLGNQQVISVNEYKKKTLNNDKSYRYLVNVTKAHNLRPSLIRWKYIDNDGVERYRNFFQQKVIKNAYINPESINKKEKEHLSSILDELHRLQKGEFTDDDGSIKKIVDGSLENTACELIMSNLYAEKFGIKDGDSLNDVLSQGEDYFYNQLKDLKEPKGIQYDLGFLKENGSNTLIKFGYIKPSIHTVSNNFNAKEEYVNDDGEIYYTKNNTKMFKIGKWIDADSNVTYDVKKKAFYKGDQKLDSSRYKLKNPLDYTGILERVDYVRRYISYDQGKYWKKNTLYEIVNLSDDVSKRIFGEEKFELNKTRLFAKIISDIYKVGDYKYACGSNSVINKNRSAFLKGVCQFFLKDEFIPQEVRDLLFTQLESQGENVATGDKVLEARKQYLKDKKSSVEEFKRQIAHKRWISFLDSLNFISSRIPAQTLQSFMSMRNVAWTNNSKNMAYVSHFLFYLQGSDLDIDKAYIMGQHYNDNGIYVGWSTLFDYSTLESFLESKKIPIPKKIKMEIDDNEGVDVTSVADTYIKNLTVSNVIDVIKKFESAKGKLKYTGENVEEFKLLVNKINLHENTPLDYAIAESAYKNVASANIWAVAHDIRNRDQAYTAITLRDMSSAAEKSPKGEQTAQLSMFNPLAKYIMLIQNLVGKNVISISANGEKVWFNTFYYWNEVLKEGKSEDILRLKFTLTFSRIQGRAKGKPEENTLKAIPDLNTRDQEIKSKLISALGFTDEDIKNNYKYVDQKISQLLSAATDNAKELVLAKINADLNFAKMYVYGFMVGYDIDDLVAFMTCPAAEYIASIASPNIFQDDSIHASPNSAINIVDGIIGVGKFLHGTVWEDVSNDGLERVKTRKDVYTLRMLNTKLQAIGINLGKLIGNLVGVETVGENDRKNWTLGKAMLAVIKEALTNKDIDLINLFLNKNGKNTIGDNEINSYLSYCQDVIEHLRDVVDLYGEDGVNEFLADVKDFKKLFELSTEQTQFTTGYLALNQGLPTDLIGILKRLNSMEQVVVRRESYFGVNKSELFLKQVQELKETDDSWDVIGKREPKALSEEQIRKNRDILISKLLENNPNLNSEEIESVINNSEDIINNFNAIRYLSDSDYKKRVRDYYGILMGTSNIFEMIDHLPQYKIIMDCLNSLVTGTDVLASKVRLVHKIINDNGLLNLSEETLRGIIRYVDLLNIYNFVKNLNELALHSEVDGFNDKYEKQKVDKIDFSTLNGIMTFKHFVENEFITYLRNNPKTAKNTLLGHLEIVPNRGKTVLATNIELLNPDVTLDSQKAYNEILGGVAELQNIKYNDTMYSCADILLLYNLLVNSNQYGDERLTTIFKVCDDKNNILHQYLRHIGNQDYDIDLDLDYDRIDYKINGAPEIYESQERFHTEEFVRVKDANRGFIIKRRNSVGEYFEYRPYVMEYDEAEADEHRYERIKNFVENCPFEMPGVLDKVLKFTYFNFEEAYGDEFDNLSPELQNEIKNKFLAFLKLYSTSSKLLIYIEC